MRNDIYLSLLEVGHVQNLIRLAVKSTGCKSDGDIIQTLKEKFRSKNTTDSKWLQTELEFKN